MKRAILKNIALVLVFTVASLALVQPRAEAMLAPASTVQSAPHVDRAVDMQTVQTTLESKIIRARLHSLGLSDEEIQTRLSKLSDAQLHQLASQVRSIHPAGEGLFIGILIVVLLVVLIIYLIKRV